MKYFIDLGTHKFEGLLELKEKLHIDNTWIIYCYEANKDVYNASLDILKDLQKTLNITYFNYAVIDYIGTITFNKHKGAWKNKSKTEYIKDYDTGANCLDINPKFDSGNGVVFDIEQEIVECIDIGSLLDYIALQDVNAEIYIKCDIEGSEFKVLPKILSNTNLKKICCLYVEWHERFWCTDAAEYKKRCNERSNIYNEFQKNNISCYNWG
jgi:FkbM family methyltransferase